MRHAAGSGEDRIPTQYRRKAGDLPGASVHYLDAVEIVEKQASKCCLNIQQSEISRNSANVAVRILGTDFPEEIVTVTAHYDSVPEGPGAYDNMSGGAMVMEAFHHSQNTDQPEPWSSSGLALRKKVWWEARIM